MRSILPSPDSTANQQSLMNGKSVLVAVSVISRLRRYHEGLRPMQCKSEKKGYYPSKQTTLFQRLYNVHEVKTTSYGCQNNVVCVLGYN